MFVAGLMVTLLCLSVNYQASQDGGVMWDGVYQPLALSRHGKKKHIYLHLHYYSEILRASYDCFGWEGGGWPMVALQEDVDAAVAAPPLEVAAGSDGSAAVAAPPLEVAEVSGSSAAVAAPPRSPSPGTIPSPVHLLKEAAQPSGEAMQLQHRSERSTLGGTIPSSLQTTQPGTLRVSSFSGDGSCQRPR